MEGLQRAWSLMLVRGIVSLIFGALIIFYPVLSLRLLIIFFAAYVLVWGLFNTFYALRDRQPHWKFMLLEGIFGILIGAVMLMMPKLSAIMVLYVVAVWAVLSGIMQLAIAIKWRKHIQNDFWLGLAGILGILFGILIVVYPHDGILAIAWLFGVYVILAGIALIILGFKLRRQNS